jgi:DeoR/GlpR family transcriptional regulator of sugar metabolism
MRVPRDVVDRRRKALRKLIQGDGFLTLTNVCRRLQISEATARRDLVAIESEGHITRTYGGAIADYNRAFASLDERSRKARIAKSQIAEKAAALIPRTGTVFLDAGTTILALARVISYRDDLTHLVVVTNSLAAASVLSNAAAVELHVLGGMFLNHQAALMGDHAIRSVDQWTFDAAFLGAMGMDATGIGNSHESIADFQKAILRQSGEIYFCMDTSKVGRAAPYRVTPWKRISALITDASARRLSAHGIALESSRLLRT